MAILLPHPLMFHVTRCTLTSACYVCADHVAHHTAQHDKGNIYIATGCGTATCPIGNAMLVKDDYTLIIYSAEKAAA